MAFDASEQTYNGKCKRLSAIIFVEAQRNHVFCKKYTLTRSTPENRLPHKSRNQSFLFF